MTPIFAWLTVSPLSLTAWRMAPTPSFDHCQCSLAGAEGFMSGWLWLSYQLSFLLHNPVNNLHSRLLWRGNDWPGGHGTPETLLRHSDTNPSPHPPWLRRFSWHGQWSATRASLSSYQAGAVSWGEIIAGISFLNGKDDVRDVGGQEVYIYIFL